MSIQSIIGGQALALNTGLCVPPIFQRDVGLGPLLACALGLSNAEGTSHQQDAVDGLPRRHRGRTRVSGTNRLESSVFPRFGTPRAVANTPFSIIRHTAVYSVASRDGSSAS